MVGTGEHPPEDKDMSDTDGMGAEDAGFDDLQQLWQSDNASPATNVDFADLARKQGLIWWRMRILAGAECLVSLVTSIVFFSFMTYPWPGPVVAIWGGVTMILASIIPILSRRGSWGRADDDLASVLEAERRHHIAAVRYFRWTTWLTVSSLPLPAIAFWFVVSKAGIGSEKTLIVGTIFGAMTMLFLLMPLITNRWIKNRQEKLAHLESMIADQSDKMQ